MKVETVHQRRISATTELRKGTYQGYREAGCMSCLPYSWYITRYWNDFYWMRRCLERMGLVEWSKQFDEWLQNKTSNDRQITKQDLIELRHLIEKIALYIYYFQPKAHAPYRQDRLVITEPKTVTIPNLLLDYQPASAEGRDETTDMTIHVPEYPYQWCDPNDERYKKLAEQFCAAAAGIYLYLQHFGESLLVQNGVDGKHPLYNKLMEHDELNQQRDAPLCCWPALKKKHLIRFISFILITTFLITESVTPFNFAKKSGNSLFMCWLYFTAGLTVNTPLIVDAVPGIVNDLILGNLFILEEDGIRKNITESDEKWQEWLKKIGLLLLVLICFVAGFEFGTLGGDSYASFIDSSSLSGGFSSRGANLALVGFSSLAFTSLFYAFTVSKIKKGMGKDGLCANIYGYFWVYFTGDRQALCGERGLRIFLFIVVMAALIGLFIAIPGLFQGAIVAAMGNPHILGVGSGFVHVISSVAAKWIMPVMIQWFYSFNLVKAGLALSDALCYVLFNFTEAKHRIAAWWRDADWTTIFYLAVKIALLILLVINANGQSLGFQEAANGAMAVIARICGFCGSFFANATSIHEVTQSVDPIPQEKVDQKTDHLSLAPASMTSIDETRTTDAAKITILTAPSSAPAGKKVMTERDLFQRGIGQDGIRQSRLSFFPTLADLRGTPGGTIQAGTPQKQSVITSQSLDTDTYKPLVDTSLVDDGL